jgi:predicted phage terminase large subunit-like protein
MTAIMDVSRVLETLTGRDLAEARTLWNEQERREADRIVAAEAKVLAASFRAFVHAAWPLIEPGRELGWNWHLDILCEYLEAVARRDETRLVINVPPRTMKSILVNVMFPVWVWLNQPSHQFLNVSSDVGLATRDSMRSRRIIESEWFQRRWGGSVTLASDQNAKQWYENTANGHRQALGILANVTGRGADTILVDDPHDAKGAQSDAERAAVLSAFDDALQSRLNDQTTGAIVIIMQRLHDQDLAGHVLAKGGWTHVCLPMEFEPGRVDGYDLDPRTKPGELLWPERFPAKVIARMKTDMTPYAYSGQYQQRPTPAEGGILKRAWWRSWPGDKALPACESVVICWDGAFQAKESNDFTAATVWGVFFNEQDQRHNAILLERYNKQTDFPELRKEARELYLKHEADVVLIEPKATGKPLVQELRRAGVPAMEWQPERSGKGRELDKTARTHAASTVLWGGAVWYPTRKDGTPFAWVSEVVDQCAAFPNAAHDDLTDTCSMAWLYLRRGYQVAVTDDPEDEPDVRDDRAAAERLATYG